MAGREGAAICGAGRAAMGGAAGRDMAGAAGRAIAGGAAGRAIAGGAAGRAAGAAAAGGPPCFPCWANAPALNAIEEIPRKTATTPRPRGSMIVAPRHTSPVKRNAQATESFARTLLLWIDFSRHAATHSRTFHPC